MASSTVTATPGCSRTVLCTKFAPMKPAPPVTSSRMVKTLAEQGPRKFRKHRHQLFVVLAVLRAAQYLDRDVVGAGVQVLAEALGDGLGGAVGHHRVDQPVAARLLDVVLGEAQPQP